MAKTAPSIKPTAAELNLLRVLWQLGPATVKQAHLAMQAERADITYATVLRQMQLMHAKGLLTRDETQRSHVYAPAQSQNALQTNLLKELIHKAFAGSGKALVLAALRGHVTKEERDEIQEFLHGEDQ
ncbi:BlaI/MecI/CopY family transcriptional regulator [Cupriavidus basilensis]|uniref:BlaI/MecI/CopY family transcriptional regulator n=1 Tax=Cupriavidus basilensis TaxID=68895 RepID=A0A643FZF7_9BURK|nr:BlaI/MecI/CopY family transcriptional regulator [Cupriavidus basilensis]MCP3017750.1 BlaI/MecI/CopY family transcriptional regulator [Cupriavidus basilensis]QOT78063.1 BlaI/MecI/CopY family transcriptional regulator [Cupriavidus basilensis]